MKVLAKIWWLLAGIAVFGGYVLTQTVWTVATNSEVTEMTCAAYVDSPPDARWLRLTDCAPVVEEISFSHYRFSESDATEIYVPYRPTSAETGAIELVVETESAEWKTLIRMMHEAGDDASESDVAEILASHGDLLNPTTIEGLVQTGTYLDDDIVEELKASMNNLSPTFALIKHGDKPSWNLVIYQACLFVVFAAGGLAGARRRFYGGF